MSVIKIKRFENYTVIPNRILENKNLRLQDKGLLAYLLSKPSAWQIRVDVLTSELGHGRDAIYSMLKNIRSEGYALYTRYPDGRTDWIIFDEPNAGNPDPENPDPENPDPGFPHDIVSTDIEVSTERALSTNARARKTQSKSISADLFFDVTEQTKADFKKLRLAKKAPITERAMSAIRSEAEKAGISLETALIECCARGWTGFKADWYLKSNQQPGNVAHIANRSEYSRQQTELAKQRLFGNIFNEKDVTNG